MTDRDRDWQLTGEAWLVGCLALAIALYQEAVVELLLAFVVALLVLVLRSLRRIESSLADER